MATNRKPKGEKRRPKGEGSITMLPNGNIKLTLTLGKGLNGKQVRRSFTGKTREEVLQKASELRLAVSKGLPKVTVPTFQEVYKQFSEEWFIDKSYRLKWSYRAMMGHIEDELNPLRINKITTEYLTQLFLSKVTPKLKNSSVLHAKRLLATVFNYAIEKGYISTNPCHKLLPGLKAVRKADLVIITKEQLKTLMDNVKEFDKRKRRFTEVLLYPIFLLAAATGMRRGEVLGLRKSAIDLKKGIVDIRVQVQHYTADTPLKTSGSYRQIYVDKKVLKYILDASDKDSEFVFADPRTHSFISSPDFGSYLAHFFQVYPRPCEGFSFHSLRHYHATQLLTKGLDPKSVSRRLGHTNIKTTLDRYAHWIPEVDAKAAKIAGKELFL